jgi:phosphoribosylformimino-5-aminoimidazole carboxamide ribotide isomerase
VQIIPAIDIRDGRCVRLRQGDYAQETVFGDDPAAAAQRWVSEGATLLHLVDLDGARAGRLVNTQAIRRIVQAAGVPCQLGGGLRSDADLDAAWELGLTRLVVGTQALKEPDWFTRMSQLYPNKLLLGLDARDGKVATEGWLETSSCPATVLAQRFAELPLAGLIYTDISRDGMLTGPNLTAQREMAEAVRLPVIASGGVATLKDIRNLAELPLAGCIVGRSIYEGTLNLAEAIKLVGGAPP